MSNLRGTHSSLGDPRTISVFIPNVPIRPPEVSSILYKRCSGIAERCFAGIRFHLRIWRENDEDGQEKEHVRYTPLDLDKESAQFREKLLFLGSTFAFERDQIQVFFDQLKEHVAGAVGAEVDVIEVLSDG